MALLVFAAGFETTTNLIGNSVWGLLQHPDQLKLLRERPGSGRDARRRAAALRRNGADGGAPHPRCRRARGRGDPGGPDRLRDHRLGQSRPGRVQRAGPHRREPRSFPADELRGRSALLPRRIAGQGGDRDLGPGAARSLRIDRAGRSCAALPRSADAARPGVPRGRGASGRRFVRPPGSVAARDREVARWNGRRARRCRGAGRSRAAGFWERGRSALAQCLARENRVRRGRRAGSPHRQRAGGDDRAAGPRGALPLVLRRIRSPSLPRPPIR